MRFIHKNKALLAILTAATLLTLRWIWVIRENGDFGMTYEVASRISKGEVYGRDFIFCVSPLVCYGEALLIWILRGSIWSHQISLFGWWYAALIAGYLAAKKLTPDQNLLATGGVLAAMVSAPFSTCGQSYNYTATALLGLSACLYVRHQQKGSSALSLVLSGAMAGLAVFTKQNVGAAFVIFLAVFQALDSFILARQNTRRYFGEATLLLLGVAVGFGVPFLTLAVQSGSGNLFHHLLLDGVSEKGGLLLILMRILPRFSTSDLIGTAHHRLVEGSVSVALLLIIIALGWWRILRLKSSPNKTPRSQAALGSLVLAIAAIGFFSVVSLLNLPFVNEVGGRIASLFLIKSVGFGLPIGQVFYFICVAAGGFVCFFQLRNFLNKVFLKPTAAQESRTELFLITAAGAISAAPLTSGIMYGTFAAPVVLPLLVFVLVKYFQLSLNRLNLATIVIACLAFIWPTYSKTFQPYAPLPDHSPFSGLYTDKPRAEKISRMWAGVHPLVSGKTTLWLLESGPHSAYGGLSVPNVIPIDLMHTFKTEELLVNTWNRRLPERVVIDRTLFRSSTRLPPNSVFFSDKWLSAWLEKNYFKIFEDHFPGQDIEVWSILTAPQQPSEAKVGTLQHDATTLSHSSLLIK